MSVDKQRFTSVLCTSPKNGGFTDLLGLTHLRESVAQSVMTMSYDRIDLISDATAFQENY